MTISQYTFNLGPQPTEIVDINLDVVLDIIELEVEVELS